MAQEWCHFNEIHHLFIFFEIFTQLGDEDFLFKVQQFSKLLATWLTPKSPRGSDKTQMCYKI